MIKFSTKTNYKLVSIVQRIILSILRLFKKPHTQVIIKRNQIHWKLNLSEVIDFMVYLVGGFDKAGSKAFGKQISKNSTIIDIGANIGSFSLEVSKYLSDQGRIIAIEPSTYAYRKFQSNLKLNPNLLNRITPVHAFITQNNNPVPKEIYASWDIQSEDPRHNNHKGILTSTYGAISLSLDQLVDHFSISKLDWLKIDVDGFEKDVLFGGRHIFKKHKPNVFMELCEYSLEEHNTSIEELLDFLICFGYQFYSVKGKPFNQDIEAIRKTIPKMGTINIFAYPNLL